MRESKELREKLYREMAAHEQELEARRAARLAKEARDASWNTWFMDYCLQSIVYSLAACVAIYVVQNWHNPRAIHTRLEEEMRKQKELARQDG